MRDEQVRIATPCHEDWSAMTGDRKRRHCGSCDRHVHDLSAMTEPEAEALVVGASEPLCVRYAVRADGTLLHVPTGRLPRWFAVAGALLSAAPAFASGLPAPEGPPASEPTFLDRVQSKLMSVAGLPAKVVSIEPVQVMMGAPPPPPEPEPEPVQVLGRVQLVEPPPPPPPSTDTIPELQDAAAR